MKENDIKISGLVETNKDWEDSEIKEMLTTDA
jgi:hypothetical protein